MTPYKSKIPIQVRFRDIDRLGHVNSAVHFTYFELSRIHYFNALFGKEGRRYWAEINIVVAKAEMNYVQQLLLEDVIHSYTWVSRIGNKSFDMDFSLVKSENGAEIEVARGKAVLVCINLKTNQTVPVPEAWREKMISSN